VKKQIWHKMKNSAVGDERPACGVRVSIGCERLRVSGHLAMDASYVCNERDNGKGKAKHERQSQPLICDRFPLPSSEAQIPAMGP